MSRKSLQFVTGKQPPSLLARQCVMRQRSAQPIGLISALLVAAALVNPVTAVAQPAVSLVERALEAKASDYLLDLRGRHMQDGQIVSRNKEGVADDQGDAAIWTGVYAATEALRFKATSSPEAFRNLSEALDTLHRLQFDTAQPGVLTRMIVGGAPYVPGNASRNFASKDTYAGVLYGYAAAYSALSPGALKRQVRRDVDAIANHYLSNGRTFQGAYGSRRFVVDFNPGFSLDTALYLLEKSPTEIDSALSGLHALRKDGWLSLAALWLGWAIPDVDIVLTRWEWVGAGGPQEWCAVRDGRQQDSGKCFIRTNFSKDDVREGVGFLRAVADLLVPLSGADFSEPALALTPERRAIKWFLDEALEAFEPLPEGPSPCMPLRCLQARVETVAAAVQKHWSGPPHPKNPTGPLGPLPIPPNPRGVTDLTNVMLRLVHRAPGGVSLLLGSVFAGLSPEQVRHALRDFDPALRELVLRWLADPGQYQAIVRKLTTLLPVSVERPEQVRILGAEALLNLYVLKVASAITRDARYERQYQADRVEFTDIATKWSTALDDVVSGLFGEDAADVWRGGASHLKWLALDRLLTLESNPAARAAYVALMRKEFAPVRDEQNAFVSFVHQIHSRPGDADLQATREATHALWAFPSFDPQGQQFHYTCTNAVVRLAFGGCLQFMDQRATRRPISLDARPRDAFTWQRSPRRLAGEPDKIYAGLDYLFAYWLARAHAALAIEARPMAGLEVTATSWRSPDQPVVLVASVGDGTYLDFNWDFGDGQQGRGQSVNHVYSAEGDYAVGVTATDAFGHVAQATGVVRAHSLFRLSVRKVGTGDGTIHSVPAGVHCGFDGETCDLMLPAGSTLELGWTAHPGKYHFSCRGAFDCRWRWDPKPDEFSKWAGDCNGTGACELEMSDDRSVAAVFCDGDRGCGLVDIGEDVRFYRTGSHYNGGDSSFVKVLSLDANRDGCLDLLHVRTDNGPGFDAGGELIFRVHLSDCRGGFVGQPWHRSGSHYNGGENTYYDVVIGDVDGKNGEEPIAIRTDDGGEVIFRAFPSDGRGGFANLPWYRSGSHYNGGDSFFVKILTLDANRDGCRDVLHVRTDNGTEFSRGGELIFRAHLSDCRSGFVGQPWHRSGSHYNGGENTYYDVIIGDVDGRDGDEPIAVRTNDGGEVILRAFPSNGNGSFRNQDWYRSGSHYTGGERSIVRVRVLDANDDGCQDVVHARTDNGPGFETGGELIFRAHLSDCGRSFIGQPWHHTGMHYNGGEQTTYDVLVGDLSGEGATDVLHVRTNDGGELIVAPRLSRGNGEFQNVSPTYAQTLYAAPGQFSTTVLADLTGDGADDFVLVRTYGAGELVFVVFESDGAGGFINRD